MVSKDWMNDENDDGESKKGKSIFSYTDVRDLEQERLEDKVATNNVNKGSERQGSGLGETNP